MAQPILHGDGTTLRPVREYSVEFLAARLAAILAEPEVRAWWPGYDLQRVRSELLDCDDAVVFTIEVDGEVVGAILYCEEPDADYRHAGIDVFLHPAAHGRGLGSDAVRTLAWYLFGDRRHHRLTIDPAVANTKAIACYKRVGFREVGVMRQYERGERGEWHDSLLMDMLRHELC